VERRIEALMRMAAAAEATETRPARGACIENSRR
jgi:hypothetical protein